jgi:hypothetical protein
VERAVSWVAGVRYRPARLSKRIRRINAGYRVGFFSSSYQPTIIALSADDLTVQKENERERYLLEVICRRIMLIFSEHQISQHH